ncbi:rCG61584, isoform CRA_a [Rattus norvegicus]|nr:rCG61584, isoform CRA_a [Rattus norvegicus]
MSLVKIASSFFRRKKIKRRSRFSSESSILRMTRQNFMPKFLLIFLSSSSINKNKMLING